MRGIIIAVMILPTVALSQGLDWRTYNSNVGDLSVDVPVDVFSVDKGIPTAGPGRSFATADGRADLGIYTLKNLRKDSPRTFMRRNFRLPPEASVTYRYVTERMLALSGFRGSKIWYARCNFGRENIRCIALNYPAQEKRQWDAIITRISNSLT